MHSFAFEPFPTRVVFGSGAVRGVGEEIASLGIRHPLFVTTKGRAELARVLCSGTDQGRVFDEAVVHAPSECVDAALATAAEMDADGLVACGGGSPIGIAKAVAVTREMPILAVPTTYSGSEMTPAWSVTKNGIKSGGKNRSVVPRTVIYDPNLTASMPRTIAVTSAINAMAHCAEALYPKDQSPLVGTMAEAGLRRISWALRRLETSDFLALQDDLLYGAHLSGLVMAHSGMAFHHKTCHVLGGMFGLPHSETHTVILPHALAYNAAAAPRAMQRIADAIESVTAPGGLWDLAQRCSAPMSLRALGFAPDYAEAVADKIIEAPYPNPRPMERDAIITMLHNAYEGRRPQ